MWPTVKKLDISQINLPGWKKMTEKNQSFCLRFFWILVVVFSMVICIFQISERVTFFNKSTTSVAIRFDLNPRLQFPYVIICPKYYTNSIHSFYGYIDNVRLAQLNLTSTSETAELCDYIGLNRTVEEIWLRTANPNLLGTIAYVQDGFSRTAFSEILEYDSIFGKCIITRATSPDIRPMSELHVHVPADNTVRYLLHLYTVLFHQTPIINDYDLLASEKIYNSNSMQFSLKIEHNQVLNTTKNPCVSIEEFDSCRQRCLNDKFKTKLNCRLPFVNDSSKPICQTVSQCKLAMQMAKLILQHHGWKNCSCIRSCSFSTYNSMLARGHLNHKRNYKVEVNFQDFQTQSLVEFVSYTSVSLLCDIGGILSLFLGFCFLSFLEVLDSLFYQTDSNKIDVNPFKIHKHQAWVNKNVLKNYDKQFKPKFVSTHYH